MSTSAIDDDEMIIMRPRRTFTAQVEVYTRQDKFGFCTQVYPRMGEIVYGIAIVSVAANSAEEAMHNHDVFIAKDWTRARQRAIRRRGRA